MEANVPGNISGQGKMFYALFQNFRKGFDQCARPSETSILCHKKIELFLCHIFLLAMKHCICETCCAVYGISPNHTVDVFLLQLDGFEELFNLSHRKAAASVVQLIPPKVRIPGRCVWGG